MNIGHLNKAWDNLVKILLILSQVGCTSVCKDNEDED